MKLIRLFLIASFISLFMSDAGNAQQRARSPKIPDDVEIVRDVVFGKGGDRELKLHLAFPKQRADKPLPVYVWVHGGGWRKGSKESGIGHLVRMTRQGYAGATIEYRLSGEATFPAQIEDCKCAIRFLRAHADKYGINPDRIAVGGSSAGGHLVALLGTTGDVKELEGSGGWPDQSSRVQAVVDLYGPTDLVKFVQTYKSHAKPDSPESHLLGGPVLDHLDRAKRANPITYVDASAPPFLIFHGSADGVVPPNQSELLHAALGKAGVKSELHILEGAGHGGRAFAAPAVLRKQHDFLKEAFRSD